MKEIKEKHALLMRWTHWINFPILTIMIWSGLLIYWANDEYTLTLFGHTFFRFFPDWFYKWLKVPSHLAEGLSFHFLFMWFFTLNGIFYIGYTLITGDWKEMVPQRKSFKEAFLVVLHDLHIIKIAPPQNKYNAAQRIAYTSIIVMGAGSVLTGLAIYKPVQFSWLVWIFGGYHFARIIHFVLTLGYVLFFIIHIVQVMLAGWNNFRSVVSGFEVVYIDPKPEKEVLDNNEKAPMPELSSSMVSREKEGASPKQIKETRISEIDPSENLEYDHKISGKEALDTLDFKDEKVEESDHSGNNKEKNDANPLKLDGENLPRA